MVLSLTGMCTFTRTQVCKSCFYHVRDVCRIRRDLFSSNEILLLLLLVLLLLLLLFFLLLLLYNYSDMVSIVNVFMVRLTVLPVQRISGTASIPVIISIIRRMSLSI